MIRCVLFDRDGTLGELIDKRFPESLIPFCDIKAVFDEIKAAGYIVGIITNQSSIARGTAKDYDFAAEFRAYGADVWEICPHDTKDGCDCRKPKSGLLLSAANRLGISPKECLVIGDRLSDVQCAKNVGAEGILVLTGYGENEKERVLQTYPNTILLQRFDEILSLLKNNFI